MEYNKMLFNKEHPFSLLLKPCRIKVLYSGRASGKSHTIAEFLVRIAIECNTTILCLREYQSKMSQSVHKLIGIKIKELGFSHLFTITRDEIECKRTGTKFVFSGMSKDPEGIKSIENVGFVWFEESNKMTEFSWEVLEPTIRANDSEIIFSFNPGTETEFMYSNFILNTPPDCVLINANYDKNPYLSKTMLKTIANKQKEDAYKFEHIYLGKPKKISDSVIFKNRFEIVDFEETPRCKFDEFTIPYWGCDWGFSNDPATLIRCYIRDNNLYIDKEFYQTGVDIDDLVLEFKKYPIAYNELKCDSASPGNISYLLKNGINAVGAKKWAGSINDGIEFIKSFNKIYVDKNCINLINELNNYSYKIDKNTGKITTAIEDKDNHLIDALRYSLSDLIKNDNVVDTWNTIAENNVY